jgi:D-galactonate transporter
MSTIPARLAFGDASVAAVQERDEIWSRINWRLVPIVVVGYMMAFLDRINVGYAKLTMQHDLTFSDEVYGLGAGIFFLSYLLFELPSNLWMERIGARKTFLRIMVLWGLASAATALVTTPAQFYLMRLLLGVFEAGFFPGMMLYLTYWYPSERRGRVTGLFFLGMPITGVIGGPLSGWILKSFDGVGGWHGWQWVFVLEGIPTVLFGIVVYLLLSDRPATAPWLSVREKQVVEAIMAADRRETPSTRVGGKLRAALGDPRTWILAFVYFTSACAVYTFTFWLPTMVKALGITDLSHIGWYTSIPFACGALGILAVSRSSDHFRERRWHVASTLAVGSTSLYLTQFLGGAFIPTMIMLSVAAFFIFATTLFWSVPPTYLSEDAAATGIAVISSIGILGGFVSPVLIGWIKTLTGSMQYGLLAMTVVISLGGLVMLIAIPARALRVGPATSR